MSEANTELQCVVPGCERPGVDSSNQYRTDPVLCKECYTWDSTNATKPKKCGYCGKRRQGRFDQNGIVRCRECFHDQLRAEESNRRNSHDHAIANATMEFDPDGTPATIRINTHCQWGERAELDMVDGAPTYILLSGERPMALHYNPENATCERCRRNGRRELEKRRLREEPTTTAAQGPAETGDRP